ncbi:MAG: CBS domain-containing protein [Candidatus Scalindua sp.]
MISVNQLLKDKQGKVLTVTPDDTLFKALKVMADKNIGALVVVKEEKVVGIFTERDFVRNAVVDKKLSMDLTVKELMSTKVCYVRPEQTIDDCMVLMTEKRTRHLPVIEEEKLIGIVSIGDVLKNSIAEKDFTIHQLENYISGGL